MLEYTIHISKMYSQIRI